MMNYTAQGTITKIYLQEIQSKVKGGKSRFETKIELAIMDVSSDANTQEIFAGPPELIDKYKVGQTIFVTATTSSGRHIESIKVIKLEDSQLSGEEG